MTPRLRIASGPIGLVVSSQPGDRNISISPRLIVVLYWTLIAPRAATIARSRYFTRLTDRQEAGSAKEFESTLHTVTMISELSDPRGRSEAELRGWRTVVAIFYSVCSPSARSFFRLRSL